MKQLQAAEPFCKVIIRPRFVGCALALRSSGTCKWFYLHAEHPEPVRLDGWVSLGAFEFIPFTTFGSFKLFVLL